MTRHTRREYLEADLATVEAMLAALPADRPIERMGLEDRRDDLRAQINALTVEGQEEAEVDLLFEGDAVINTEGIDARFSTDTLGGYQDLVAGLLAQKQRGALGASGPFPGQRESRLFITDMPRSSVGFELRELPQGQTELLPSPLRETVQDVTETLVATAESDDSFLDAVAGLDPRVFSKLAEFFATLRKGGVDFKIRIGRDIYLIDRAGIDAAAERSAALHIDQDDVPMIGRFMGVFPEARRFEHKLPTNEVLHGKIDPSLDPHSLRQWEDRECVAHVRVVTVERTGKKNNRYTLLRINEIKP